MIRMLAVGRRLVTLLGISLVLALGLPHPGQAQNPTCVVRVTNFATFTACNGTLADGRPYGLRVPNNWNGTLILISHGYVAPGSTFLLAPYLNQGPAQWFLGNGYAVAGSFGGTGWCVHEAIHNQIETLDIFTSMYGPPTRTIAYGGSLGGIISAGLVQQHPERFAGALPFSGPLAGSVGTWNQALDFSFVVQQLLGSGSGLQVVGIADPGTPTSGNWGLAVQLLTAAQETPEGRARIALACAMQDIPGWYDPNTSEPASDDYATQEANQFLWARDILAPMVFGYGRAEVEARSGGNPSWNTDVNYEAELGSSVNSAEVASLYQAAGLNLQDDLDRLAATPRITADPSAVEYMSENVVFNGDLSGIPVLALHTTGDGFVVVQNEFPYRSAALEAKDSQLLRQAYVHRGGHVTLSWAEIIAGFQALIQRIDTGKWQGSASPEGLNAAAQALGPSYYIWPPSYVDYDPAPFLRPYNLDPGTVLAARSFSEFQGTTLTTKAPAATRPLSAWPLPYHGGPLQVSLRAGASAGETGVGIYDVSGRRVRLLTDSDRGGFGLLQWDGRDARGVDVGSGIYFLRATAPGQNAPLKIAVIR